jgi:dihydropteroate synthase
MKIRRLYLTNGDDFTAELKYAGVEQVAKSVKTYLPSHFIFKFYDLSADSYQQLLSLFQKRSYPFWTNRNLPKRSILVSFPDWGALEEFPKDEFYSELNTLKSDSFREKWEFKLPNSILKIDRPLVMGILNITPDSFSDGGRFLKADSAIAQAELMAAQGADIIDIGAESTRPGATRVDLEEEWQRLEFVLMQLKNRIDLPLSIDTYKSEIARRALDIGADIVNDISGMTFDQEMATVVGECGCPVILMHIKGTPREMQKDPQYGNMMEELFSFFHERIKFCEQMHIRQVIIDPGIGFGKRLIDNYEIIRRLPEFRAFGHPVLIGPSRKSFIGNILKNKAEERLMGTAAAVGASLMNGANIIRVHDVGKMKEICEILNAVQRKNFLRSFD